MKNTIRSWLIVLLLGGGFAIAQPPHPFYAVDKIQDIQITFEQDDWRYLLDSLRFNGDDMLLGDVEINGETLRDVGVRYRDGRSFKPNQPRNGLFIELDFINADQAYQGHENINLSSALRDPSMVREVIGYEIARQYMPAPRANYAKVKINGQYYGLFVNVEPIGQTFLDRHFHYTGGALFFSRPKVGEPAPPGCRSGVDGTLQLDTRARCYLSNFEMISEDGWDELIELTRRLQEEPEAVDNMLHIDRTLWMLAFNNILVNLSSYSGQGSPNYYLYQDQLGRFTPIIWDLNLAFGSFKNTGIGSDLGLTDMQKLNPLLHAGNSSKPLINRLLDNELYKKIYLAHLRTLLNEAFRSGQFEARVKELQKLIAEAFEEDPNRSYSMEEFSASLEQTIGDRSRIPGILELMNPRTEFLKRHASMTIVPPVITNIEVMSRPRFSSERVKDFKVQARVEEYPKRVYLYYRFDPEQPFEEMRMYDDGRHHDGKANDGIFGVGVDPGRTDASMEYFIFAENAGAVSYAPEHYVNAPRKVSLEDLNR